MLQNSQFIPPLKRWDELEEPLGKRLNSSVSRLCN
jgi:hypothetical protein